MIVTACPSGNKAVNPVFAPRYNTGGKIFEVSLPELYYSLSRAEVAAANGYLRAVFGSLISV